jgi:hypothetical protein
MEIQGWLKAFRISWSSAFCLLFFFFATIHSVPSLRAEQVVRRQYRTMICPANQALRHA